MNEEAKILARVAIRAKCDFEKWFDESFVTNGNMTAEQLGQMEIERVAAAIDRHMVCEYTLKDGHRLMRPNQVTTVHAGTTWSNLYRITQEPRGGEDGN